MKIYFLDHTFSILKYSLWISFRKLSRVVESNDFSDLLFNWTLPNISNLNYFQWSLHCANLRGASRTAATSKVELFVITVNGWKTLTIIRKSSTLDVAVVLNSPLNLLQLRIRAFFQWNNTKAWCAVENVRRTNNISN